MGIEHHFFLRDVSAGQFQFALDGSYVPLIKLVYHKLEVVSPEGVYGIFACLSHESRIELVRKDFKTNYLLYSQGTVSFPPEDTALKAYPYNFTNLGLIELSNSVKRFLDVKKTPATVDDSMDGYSKYTSEEDEIVGLPI